MKFKTQPSTSLRKFIVFTTFFLTIVCGCQWAGLALNQFIIWAFTALYLGAAIKISRFCSPAICTFDKNLYKIYIFWIIIEVIRGTFFETMGNYWIWKDLMTGTFALFIPILTFIYVSPDLLRSILRFWYKYALICFVLFIPFLPIGSYHFYLGPLYIVTAVWMIFPKRWMMIFIGLTLLMIFIDPGARSQVLKTGVILIISMAYFFRKFISLKLLKIIHWILYILPVVLLILGITGKFNVFEDLSSNEGKYTSTTIGSGGQKEVEDLSADTRTFIYVEIIQSALKHNYVIWGRTPARGNDSDFFGAFYAEDLKTGLYERHANETGLPSIFTWTGLIGLVLLSCIYIRSSFLAVYRSNNNYIKLIGCFVAFRWCYGWIEDMYNYTPMILSLWMMIAMCLSKKFRSMNDNEMKQWLLSLVSRRKSVSFNTLQK